MMVAPASALTPSTLRNSVSTRIRASMSSASGPTSSSMSAFNTPPMSTTRAPGAEG